MIKEIIKYTNMNEFDLPELTGKEERLRKKVQSKIEYCSYCQPYDEGEVIWIYGDQIELNDLMDDCNVPEKDKQKIARHLHCPYCGHADFDLGFEVGVKTRFEKQVDAHMEEVYGLYGDEVIELENLLEQYPLLAYQNKLAKRIHKEINQRKLPFTIIQGEFYRARKVESSEVLSSGKMYNPPVGKPSEGRFNHAGQSHLYLANDKATSIKEVISDEHAVLVWTQKFEISKTVNDILDLSFDWSKLTPSTSTLLLSLKVYNTIGRNDRNKENWKPDYFLTRYLMDCAKQAGYKGIKYNSTKDEYNFDLVLFYPDQVKITAVGKPTIEIFLNKQEEEKFTSDLLDIDV
ncbi:RES family NAD+ phosphorylase [Chitinophagaceae bacterium 26-R-25]|nr:RES family NAD+ phosphorylase [Chitinophagaceae bacterium 26-R-25]